MTDDEDLTIMKDSTRTYEAKAQDRRMKLQSKALLNSVLAPTLELQYNT